MSNVPHISVTERPYWIIVSDEGPARFPFKHETYKAAYDESIRLSKLAPGIKFNVFKYGGHAFTPKPVEVATTFHTYSEPVPGWQYYWGPRYNRQDDNIPF